MHREPFTANSAKKLMEPSKAIKKILSLFNSSARSLKEVALDRSN
jgi:hypothetical protein